MKHSLRSGFSILELAVVLTVISLIVGSSLAVGATRMQAAKVQDTEAKMKAIMDTLDAFVQTYGYVPCPADPIVPITDATFGRANCTIAAAHLLGGGNTRIGVVPTAALNLAPSVMMDGWSRRITYAMDVRLNTADNYAANDPLIIGDPWLQLLSDTPGSAQNTITSQAVVVLVSHGPNGHGAWKAKGGTTQALALLTADPTPTDTSEIQNCNITGTCHPGSTFNVFVQKFRTESFDDIVYYRMKWQFPCLISSPIAGNKYVCK